MFDNIFFVGYLIISTYFICHSLLCIENKNTLYIIRVYLVYKSSNLLKGCYTYFRLVFLFSLDLHQFWLKFPIKREFFFKNIWWVDLKCLPLHPLSGLTPWGIKNEKERVLWNIDRQISSSTRSICAYVYHKCLWVKNEPSIHLLLVVDTQIGYMASWTDISFSLPLWYWEKEITIQLFTM